MSYTFTPNGLTYLSTLADGTAVNLKIALLTNIAVDDDGNIMLDYEKSVAIDDKIMLDDILLVPERWREVVDPNYVRETVTATLRVIDSNRYLCLSSSIVFNMDIRPVPVKMFAVLSGTGNAGVDEDELLWLTDSPFAYYLYPHFLNGNILNIPADPSVVYDGNPQRWLLGWSTPLTETSFRFNGLSVSLVSLPFEASHAHSIWMYPQRINFVANPSFESLTTDFWRVSDNSEMAVVNRNSPPVDGVYFDWLATGNHAAAVYNSTVLDQSFTSKYDPDKRIYAATNTFSYSENRYTFQAKVGGRGTVRVGLATYDQFFDSYRVDWGLRPSGVYEEWELHSDMVTPISGLRNVFEVAYPETRLVFEARGYFDDEDEFVPPILVLDDVLLEPGVLLDWPYFDGDTTYGMESVNGDHDSADFSWYGNVPFSEKRGASFSFWYNNKAVTAGRLFGRYLDDDALYTSTDEQRDGLLYQWAPAGSVFLPKFNVLRAFDPQIPPHSENPLLPWTHLLTVPDYEQVFSAFPIDTDGGTLETGTRLSYMEMYENLTGRYIEYSIPFIEELETPIDRAFLVNGEDVIPVDIVSRQYSPPPNDPDNIVPNRYIFQWPEILVPDNSTLYVERGSERSPKSWRGLSLFDDLGRVGRATVLAFDADLAFAASEQPLMVASYNPHIETEENVDDNAVVNVEAFISRISLDSYLNLWHDGSDASSMTITAGDTVSVWQDVSYNGFTLSQATLANRPILSGTQNGYSFISKNSAGQYLSRVSSVLYGMSDFVLYAVVRRTETVADSAFISSGWPDGFSVGYTASGYIRFVAPGYTDITTTGLSTNDFEVITIRVTGLPGFPNTGVQSGQVKIYLNNTVVLAPTSFTINDVAGPFRLFDAPGWSDSTIDIAEILVYNDNGEITNSDISARNVALMDKWGI